jgi:hypothetical protein
MNQTKLEQMQARLAVQQKELAERQRQLALAIRKEALRERAEKLKYFGELFADLIPDYDQARSLSAAQQKQLVQVAKQQIKELSKTTATD